MVRSLAITSKYLSSLYYVVAEKKEILLDFSMGNRTKVDSIKAESQKSGIRRTLTE